MKSRQNNCTTADTMMKRIAVFITLHFTSKADNNIKHGSVVAH